MAGCACAPHTCPFRLHCVVICDGKEYLKSLWVLLCVLCAGKASLITIGGLVVGALVGGLVESWLRVDIVPVLGVGSPAIVVSEFVLFSLWFSSLYLR